MADTRCANPEYQLEVDVMTLEYILYYAVGAQLGALKAERSDEMEEDDEYRVDLEKKVKADRLLTMFDSFIQIFRQKHSSYELTPGTEFNMALLELLVLPQMYRQLSLSRNAFRAGSPPSSLGAHLLRDTQHNIRARRNWLESRREQLSGKGKQSAPSLNFNDQNVEAEDQIYAAWSQFQSQQSLTSSPTPAPLFDMLPRFMALSAEIARLMGDINDTWMRLACNFMVQAALELLEVNPESSDHNPDLASSSSSHVEARPGLGDCFAWGFNPLPPASSRQEATVEEDAKSAETDTENLINEIFAHLASPSSSSHPLVENPAWSQIRHEHLSEFHLPPSFISSGSISAYTECLSHLQHKYPRSAFKANLWRCLEHIFILNCSDGVSGKPVLVQIEEGRLAGLDEKEFEGFLARVGLGGDESGLRLKL